MSDPMNLAEVMKASPLLSALVKSNKEYMQFLEEF